jgi:hypothetical protein
VRKSFDDLPRPEMFIDWKEWAAAVLVALQQQEAEAPEVTGAKGGNAALANLLVALEDAGLVVDNTT